LAVPGIKMAGKNLFHLTKKFKLAGHIFSLLQALVTKTTLGKRLSHILTVILLSYHKLSVPMVLKTSWNLAVLWINLHHGARCLWKLYVNEDFAGIFLHS
jgi:hypothetical protein